MSTQSAQRQSTFSSGPASASVSGGPTTQTTFEFTKRKRWADLLITELADTCIFILSSTSKILYCNPAVNELLGWKEADVIDHEFAELVNLEDQETFQASFNESLGGRHELLAHIRLKCSTPETAYLPIKDIYFEIKGYPRFVVENNPNSGCQCFFAMAKPYPSRNIAMLNTLMELKLENERLQSKLVALKHSSSPSSNSNSLYSTSSALFSSSASSSASPQQQHQADTSSNSYYLGHGSDTVNSPIKTAFDPSALSLASANANAMANGNGDEDIEEGSKKKKLKKSHPSEQYVCNQCGRTDSPEWRKGPLGPKTLCNACGLRWAKQMRKADDPTEPPQAGAGDGTGSASETG